jgi:phenylpropionate dioxygenase-like ring-hydroxylating dioxygenase large terminal subunit
MTQTIIRPGTGSMPAGDGIQEFTPNGGRVPRLSGDIRHLIPKLGLREYWYPLIGAGRVPKKKAIRIRMQGEDLAVFRGKGQIYALTDICPHRGARLSEGDCHYDGTIACPYHGWVFDGAGKNVAVLSGVRTRSSAASPAPRRAPTRLKC